MTAGAMQRATSVQGTARQRRRAGGSMTRWLAVAPVVVALALFAGWAATTTTPEARPAPSRTAASGAAPDKGGKGAKVAYISPVAAQPGQQEINIGLDVGAKELGWRTTCSTQPLCRQAGRQRRHGHQPAAQRHRELDARSRRRGRRLRARARPGVPVVGMNSDGQGVSATVWWEYITCEPGGPQEQSAEFIAETKPKGKVIVMSGPPAPSIVERRSASPPPRRRKASASSTRRTTPRTPPRRRRGSCRIS